MSKTQPIRSTTQLNQFKKYYQEIIPEKRNYALIILGLNTALHISDILQLRVSDVWDWQKQSFKRHLEVMEKSRLPFMQGCQSISAVTPCGKHLVIMHGSKVYLRQC